MRNPALDTWQVYCVPYLLNGTGKPADPISKYTFSSQGGQLRSLDTQSTLGMPAGTAADYAEAWKLTRCVIEGYFGQTCPGKDWPSLDEVEHMHGAHGMMEFFCEAWAWDPLLDHAISLDKVLKGLDINPYQKEYVFREAVNKANHVWKLLTKYTALEEKTTGMVNVVNEQADAMVRKLHARTGSEKKIAATEQWRSQKLKDIRDHLQQTESEGLAMMNDAVATMLEAWKLVCVQVQNRRASVSASSMSSGDLLQAEAFTIPAFLAMDDDELMGEAHNDKVSALLEELEDGLGSMALKASIQSMRCRYYRGYHLLWFDQGRLDIALGQGVGFRAIYSVH